MFNVFDYIVVAGYLIAVVLLGSLTGRRNKTLNQYFLAGKRMPWLVASISILATDLSAIGYMGVPAWVFQKDLKYHLSTAMMPLIMFFILVVFLPIFYRLNVFTVYEYLEHRFHVKARTVAASLFFMQRGVWLATAIFAPSLAIATVSGIPVVGIIVVLGLLTTVYTGLGGMKAVMWTDFFQFLIMVGGLGLMIFVALSRLDVGITSVWSEASQIMAPVTGTPHTTMYDLSFNFNQEATLWALIPFMFIYNVGTYGTDQVVAQRYFTMGSFKEIGWAVISSGVFGFVMTASLAFFGLVLVVFYADHPDLAAGIAHPNRLVPTFVSTMLPTGIRGLFIAALLAATMSSVSSGLNSLSTVATLDLYKRSFRRGAQASEQALLRMGKFFTLLLGVLATTTAIWISTHDTNVIQTVVSLASKFIGPITGIFFLGVLTKRGNMTGVIVGAVAGLLVSFVIDVGAIKQNVNWLWTAPMSSVSTLIVGYLASLVSKPWRKTQKEPGPISEAKAEI